MKKQDIRQSFLKFYEGKGHTIVPSDSLIPSSDPSLLFTSAGMVQFKPHFLQQIPLTFQRAASSQRCLRTTDIEQVGLTPRHLTMFEMLGNFSFGDYFKEDAIAWAWEFLTKELGLPEKHLWPTIYKDDDEAFTIWKKFVPSSKIFRMGKETNYWTMGPTGPCGPCSEIYWDFQEKGTSDTGPDDSDRWMEIWNLVFTQFDRQADGSMKSLPKKNIDTGMGLERLTSVVERVEGNFQTSLFQPILQQTEEIFKYKTGKDPKKDISLNIVADHLRAVTMLVYDGILPSNEGRGYVLRRLLRRAVRQGSLFNVKEPFLFKGVPLVTDLFKGTASDLMGRKDAIMEIVKQEEERFWETLETGSAKLKDVMASSKKAKQKSISGQDVFRLYDTFGFPAELTKEMLAEEGLAYNEKEFEEAKSKAQEMAREGWKGSGAKDVTVYNPLLKEIHKVEFQGYDTLKIETSVAFLLKEGKIIDHLKAGDEGEIITPETPFYPEGGGQTGDKGTALDASGKSSLAVITDTQKPVPGMIVHSVKAAASIRKGQKIILQVSDTHRHPTQRHHTATHLLHAALHSVLGKNATQAGSYVSPQRLRFDFSYNKALTQDQLLKIEDIVNGVILKNIPVFPRVFPADQAKKMGAMALFGEKYGKEVRCLLVSTSDFDHIKDAFSLELCGGTHVSATGNIGAFKILSDSSVAAGVRRIEAITGEAAINHFRQMESRVNAISGKLKTNPAQLEERVAKLFDRQRQLEQEVRDLKLSLAQGGNNGASGPETQQVNGINLAIKVNDGLEVKELRVLADRLKQQVKSGVVFVASVIKDEDKEKVSFIFAVTPDLKEKGINAGTLAKSVAKDLGGSGGGRPDFAQGGGQGKENLSAAVKNIPKYLT